MAGQQRKTHPWRRYGLALTVGGVAALSLLWLMQFLIATGEAAVTEQRSVGFVEFVRVIPKEIVNPEDKRPKKPDEAKEPPRLDPIDRNDAFEGPGVNFRPDPPAKPDGIGGPAGTSALEGDLIPLVQGLPVYPHTALRKGLEGYCDLEFTVTPLGAPTDVRVIYCTSSVFERSSIRAVLKFRYKPQVVNGVPVAVSGQRQRLTFKIAQ